MKIKRTAQSIIWTVFNPDSRIERFLRTLYHRMTSSDLFTRYQMHKAQISYIDWKKKQKRKQKSHEISKKSHPTIAFFLYYDSQMFSEASITVDSICQQTNPSWNIVIQCKSTERQSFTVDPRIQVFSDSAKSLASLIESTESDFFVCCQPGDIFNPTFVSQFLEVFTHDPLAHIYYSDSETYQAQFGLRLPFFKPTAISPELLISTNYLSRGIIQKNSTLSFISLIDSNLDWIYQEWEMCFFHIEQNNPTVHIPDVLIQESESVQLDNDQLGVVLNNHFKRIGFPNSRTMSQKQNVIIRLQDDFPSVSIIIPTKNNYSVIKKLLDSILALTSESKYEIIIVDNQSTDDQVFKLYDSYDEQCSLRIVEFNEPFNYSRAINLGAEKANNPLLLFLNNDMEIQDAHWLEEMSQWTLIPEIGVVGAKLIRENHSIQHAGIVIGLQDLVGHLYLNAPEDYFGLLGSANWYRNLGAVTGACQMMRREVFEEMGGYDETYQLVFSDIEFCLRLVKNGYRIMVTPNASIKHLEGKSRGYKTPRGDLLRGFEAMREWIITGDPYFSPNLTPITIPTCTINIEDSSARQDRVEQRIKHLR